MLTITADDTARALTFDALIPALREGFRRGAHTPDRHTHSLDENSGASLLLMPSWSDGGYLGVKLVTIFPGNNALGRPALSSAYILSSATTGEHLAVLDGDELTRRRTTATSALAATYLARPDSEVLLVVGAGHIGGMLPAAYRSRFDLHTVLVHDTDPAAAQRLADTLRANGLGTEVVTDLAAATARADIISCATLATTPIIRGEWLRPGTHLDLIGSFRPHMREADDDCLRLSTVYIDTPTALAESGDLVQPVSAGAFDPATIAGTLSQLCRDEVAGRRDPDQITVFKAVGSGLADLAAAEHVLRTNAAA
ncbi:ornithine cyclodeaminase [Actinosynnema sp. ALI-1.44]|uniref:ornithine cyclodeaminase family protein n=1 Tax=Actinosynnema sp. ALI-1.44 TaxID=1933779 RepID=UPI00097C15DB|nr:ornithine cyclodeaminase family protein [Actinosynnema sp. ALI-1.44]ONI77865.1 ornithine cyclodeaminase [Actinosynnema sp. ALI-1.44]